MTVSMRLYWLLGGMILACAKGPSAIEFGLDECVHCRMIITDTRFASQAKNRNGKPYKFDSIECLVAHYREIPDLDSMWVTAYLEPGRWISAQQATYVKSPAIPSPMGGFLSAYVTEADGDSAVARYSGKRLTWFELARKD